MPEEVRDDQKSKREKFTKEFKADAVNLVIEQGYSCSEISRRFGISSSNISRCVRKFKSEQEDAPEGGVSRRELEDENKRLRKENKHLRMEREILKKRRPVCYESCIIDEEAWKRDAGK